MTAATQQAFRFPGPNTAPEKPSRTNIVIEAGAGTGKTSAIVAEVLALLLENEDLSPERIVLMTFTEKAAGEIADRIHQALVEIELHLDDETVSWPIDSANPLFQVPHGKREAYGHAIQKQIGRIDTLRSQTIHSFCQSLLRAFPLEAGLDPQFKIIEGFERSLLYGELYDAWLDEETRTSATPQTLLEWEFLLAHTGYLFQIRDLVFSLLSRRDLLSEPDYDFGDLSDIEGELLGALAVIRRSDISAVTDLNALSIFRYIRAVDAPQPGSVDAWIDYLAPVGQAIREANLPADRDLKEALVVLRSERAKSSTTIYDRLVRHRSAIAIHALANRFITFLDREKRKRGVADFDDLLLRTVALLDDPSVLERVRGQFDYIFVDEFQDTDRIQARIIERLTRDRTGRWVPGKTIVVGDPKQSIYGFRRADPETYRGMTSQLIDAGADHRILRDQYRSDPPLVDAINAMFTSVFANGGASNPNVFHPAYHELHAGRTTGARELDARITFLHSGRDDGGDRHLSEAEAVAEWIIRNRSGGDRDLQRFAILFRRLTKIDDYLEVFDRHGLAYVLPPTRAFLERRAPVDVLAVLRAIAFPFDRAAEISAARTPYFGLTDDEVAEGVIAIQDGLALPDTSPWGRFASALNTYREAARHLTVSGTIDLLVQTAAIEEIYAMTDDGHRARRHLEHLRALAFEYDQKIGGSIRLFVDEIDRRRAEPDEMEPSLADDDSNAVRILSIHAAKGLEFETVILPDLSFKTRVTDGLQLFTVEEPRSLVMNGRAQSLSAHYRFAGPATRLKSLMGEREEAEMRRLFYVAVTRAKTDVVFVCNTAAFRKEGFFGVVAETFGFEKNSFESLWPAQAGRELRQLPVAGRPVNVAFERVDVRDSAGAEHPRRLIDERLEAELGAGDLADFDSPAPSAAPRFKAQEAAISRARSKHRQSGILLHRFLELWDGASNADALLRALASESAAAKHALALVRSRVATLMLSDTLKRIMAAQTIGREIPIQFTDASGAVVERRVDRIILENGKEVVVDYKSGAPDETRLDRDRAQVAQYCRAVETMTGRPCAGLLWYIDVENDVVVDV